jgi:hypothetical protein
LVFFHQIDDLLLGLPGWKALSCFKQIPILLSIFFTIQEVDCSLFFFLAVACMLMLLFSKEHLLEILVLLLMNEFSIIIGKVITVAFILGLELILFFGFGVGVVGGLPLSLLFILLLVFLLILFLVLFVALFLFDLLGFVFNF